MSNWTEIRKLQDQLEDLQIREEELYEDRNRSALNALRIKIRTTKFKIENLKNYTPVLGPVNIDFPNPKL